MNLAIDILRHHKSVNEKNLKEVPGMVISREMRIDLRKRIKEINEALFVLEEIERRREKESEKAIVKSLSHVRLQNFT